MHTHSVVHAVRSFLIPMVAAVSVAASANEGPMAPRPGQGQERPATTVAMSAHIQPGMTVYRNTIIPNEYAKQPPDGSGVILR